MAGIGLGGTALGMGLVAAMGIGMVVALIAAGIAGLLCRPFVDRVSAGWNARFGPGSGNARMISPIVVAAFITLLGAGICIRALVEGGYLVMGLG